MRILLADDDAGYRLLLKNAVLKWGYQPVLASDGTMAWKLLQGPDAPPLAILDWMMPGINGLELCRKLRAESSKPCYVILLTANTAKEDIITGLQTGADDYVTKPFDREELYARLQVGVRVMQLQQALANRVHELEAAMAQVKQLTGLLPICCYCKNVRDDKNYWQRVEDYIGAHADVRFSHGICPTCYKNVVEDQLAKASVTSREPCACDA